VSIRIQIEKIVDLGFVGDQKGRSVGAQRGARRELIPVLARSAPPPTAAASTQRRHLRGRHRGALKAKRFLLLTDVPGVLDKSKE